MGCVALIDDSDDVLEILSLILRDRHQVWTFTNGEIFLGEFQAGNFGLILLDLVMPVMDGFEVFARIRRLDRHVPVVAITAQAGVGERENALQAGFCDYLVKPILEIERFREIVDSHIGECSKPRYSPGENLT